MKLILSFVATVTFVFGLLINAALAVDPAAIPTETQVNTLCPISGKPVDPTCTMVYEGRSYPFAGEACRKKFNEAREASLYQKLGGKAAIDAAVELFYTKVLVDDRVKHYFDDINMNKQKRKQKEFLSAALGGPLPWTGKDMRTAHADLGGLNDTHFNAIAGHLKDTLTELKVKEDLIQQALAIVETTRNDVLNRPVQPKVAAP
ncbi:MAG: hypothetical protein U0984_12325 [Prosthecobacter sp.]|nr:hypothetical protein [Prosthecobacter sp.]